MSRFLTGSLKAIRLAITVSVLLLLGILGWYAYDFATTKHQVQKLQEQINRKSKTIARLKSEIKLLQTDRRVARLTVLKQHKPDENGPTHTRLRFAEVDEQGRIIGRPHRFTINGSIVYVDGWIVKFKNKYVRSSSLHRSSSILLFRRIYGRSESPEQGHRIDGPDHVPNVYHPETDTTPFLQKVWDDFWTVANNRRKQKELGIRALHGTAGYMKVKPGRTYSVLLRSSGDVSILPIETPEN